jgi:Mor family transcriptional regulator
MNTGHDTAGVGGAMKYLSEILDKRNYLRLVHAMGGTRIWIPKSGNLGHRDEKYFIRRNKHIRNTFLRGKHVDEIAEKYGISKKRVYAIVQRVTENGKTIFRRKKNPPRSRVCHR